MLFVSILGYYCALGLIFAAYFVLMGYRAILPDAEGSGILVRLVWGCGAVALWPFLLMRWTKSKKIK
jgi:hypothetical protein